MMSKSKIFLIGILFLAGLFRSVQITYHDSYTDEPFYGFRAVELMDYDGSVVQPSPWQWFNPVPYWAHWSFHDHPLGFFILQHVSTQLIGENIIAVRLPSILGGAGAVWLVYLIARKLWGESEGLIAAGILGVQSYHIAMSRLGIQDGVAVFFLLLEFFILLKIKENARYWLLLGLIIGLGIFIKYTTLVIFPIVGLFLLIEKNKFWKEKFFWYGGLLMVLCVLPVLVYNTMLYLTRGHLDFQLSAFLGQRVPEWSFRMGREMTGDLGDKIKNFWLVLGRGNSLIFNILAGLAFISSVLFWIKKKNKSFLLIIGSIVITWAWLMIIGSTYRFVLMMLPWLVLIIAFWVRQITIYKNTFLIKACLGSLLLFEGLFSINTFFVHPSLGPVSVAYAQVNEQTQNFGFAELDQYLSGLMKNKMSALAGVPEYDFLAKIQEQRFAEKIKQKKETRALIIIYDQNINSVAALWALQRWAAYDGWPVISDRDFATITEGKMDEYYRVQGIQEFVYVAAESKKVLESDTERDNFRPLRKYLDDQGVRPENLKNKAGENVFLIYKF